MTVMFFTIACTITASIVSIWLTTVAHIAVKNFALERALKTSAYWQWRAREAEAAMERGDKPRDDGQPSWT
jgi:hypothetical protein